MPGQSSSAVRCNIKNNPLPPAQSLLSGLIQEETRSKLTDQSRTTPPARRLWTRKAKLWESRPPPRKMVCGRRDCSIHCWRRQNRKGTVVGPPPQLNRPRLRHRRRRSSPAIHESFTILPRDILTGPECFVRSEERRLGKK